MKQTIRKNITDIPYSLHDKEVNEMTVEGKKLTLHFKDGYVECQEPYDDVKGTVVFENVDWDFSFAYTFKCKEFTLENTGPIEGEKMMLKDFAEQFANMTFEIVDETFGYNTTKFEGYLYLEEGTVECNISIYHMGDMSYLVEE